MATVDQIQSEVASVIDGDPVTANISSGDYALRLKYMNMALSEWEGTYDWQCLYNEYNVLVSVATGNASIALPTDFRKPASKPFIAGKALTIIRGQENFQYQPTDQRVAFFGNPKLNYTLVVYGTTLASGASITVPYYRSAGSLATSSDVPSIPDAQYLTRRTIAFWYESHDDDRFLNAKLDAERILGNLIDYENVFAEGSSSERVHSVDEINNRFRLGDS